MRILFVLPGLHRVNRGAEIAFLAVAGELAKSGHDVTMMGSGKAPDDANYRFVNVPSVSRERFNRWKSIPVFRNEFAYEEFTFLPGLLTRYRPAEYDITVTCSYPFTNWVLKHRHQRGYRPAHIFVTQNGDWPAWSNDSEYRFFDCDGLVCINPDYEDRNRPHWNCALIPNGLDYDRFRTSAASPPSEWRLPKDVPKVLMVSSLSPYKRVLEAIDSLSRLERVHLVVAGDGPLRGDVEQLAAKKLPGRFTRLSVGHSMMPSLYQACDAFLHMAIDEPFGNVYVEAMASGLPVIGHDCRRLRWIVGESEYLVNTENSPAVATAVSNALGEVEDRKCERRKFASRYDWRLIALEYEGFFESILRTRS